MRFRSCKMGRTNLVCGHTALLAADKQVEFRKDSCNRDMESVGAEGGGCNGQDKVGERNTNLLRWSHMKKRRFRKGRGYKDQIAYLRLWKNCKKLNKRYHVLHCLQQRLWVCGIQYALEGAMRNRCSGTWHLREYIVSHKIKGFCGSQWIFFYFFAMWSPQHIKGKGCFYIAQYSVRWIAQSALHFCLPWQTCSFRHRSRLLREAF